MSWGGLFVTVSITSVLTVFWYDIYYEWGLSVSRQKFAEWVDSRQCYDAKRVLKAARQQQEELGVAQWNLNVEQLWLANFNNPWTGIWNYFEWSKYVDCKNIHRAAYDNTERQDHGTKHLRIMYLIEQGMPLKEATEYGSSLENYHNDTPLETFEVIKENNFFFDNFTFSTITSFFVIIIFAIIFFQNDLAINTNNFIFILSKTFFSLFVSLFKSLVHSIRLIRFLFVILGIFIYILFTNISGFFILELSLTSHAIITLFLSIFLFFGYFINEFIVKFETIYQKFVLNNLNIFMLPVLFIIEMISYFVRPFSLGIRLFANILSGHILIHIFFSALLVLYKLFVWLSIFLFLAVLFILFMEIFVAYIQSYIFLILSLIYLEDTI